MHTLKLVQIGNSVGVILPKEVLARLKLEKGESVFLTDTPDGVAITPYDPGSTTRSAWPRVHARVSRIPSAHWRNEGLALDRQAGTAAAA